MGRFYNTAKASFVDDKIYQPPWELMQEVIKTHDDRIDKANEDIDAFDTMMESLNNIKDDDTAVNDTINNYRGKVDELSKAMQGDIQNYQKYVPQINSLQKELKREIDNGLLGKANSAFNQREEEFKRIDETKEGSNERKAALKKYLSTRYTEREGLNFTDKDNYNEFVETAINPMNDFDTAGFINDLQGHFNSNQDAYASSGPGKGYIWSKNGVTQYIDESKVEEYMKDYLNNSNFRDTVSQELMLEGYNNGLRGAELDNYINGGLQIKERSFIDAAANQIGFKKETKKASASADSTYNQQQRRAWQQEDKEDPLVLTKTYNERRDKTEIEKDNKTFVSMQKLSNFPEIQNKYKVDTSSEESMLTSIRKLKNSGNLTNYLKDLQQAKANQDDGGKFDADLSIPSVLEYVNNTSKRGHRVPLVDLKTRGQMEPDEELEYRKQVKAVTKAIKDQDIAKNSKIIITSDFGDGFDKTETSALKLFNNGNITVRSLGGETKTVSTKAVAPPIDGFYKDSKGEDILTPDGEPAQSQEEAMAIAQAQGRNLRTVSVEQYLTELNNNPSIKDAKVYRYKAMGSNINSNQIEDNYEVEVPLIYEENGKSIYKKAILQTPTKDIEILNK